jgi:hypothetical protein
MTQEITSLGYPDSAFAILSTYPPTQCGLTTFAAALVAHLSQPGSMTLWLARPKARQLPRTWLTALTS